MSDPGKAVFLSYASQDAEAAHKICNALHSSGVEVWIDQSELVGGDQWDQKIRGQIGSCALFIPIISANTQARLEGYFRREWKQAAARTYDMADEKTFLLPVVIDGTRDAEAKVPPEFKSVQWTKLLGGETPPAFCARVKKLLEGEVAGGAFAPEPSAPSERKAHPATKPSRPWLVPAIMGALACAAAAYFWFNPRRGPEEMVKAAVPAPTLREQAATRAGVEKSPATLSPARQLVQRARVLIELPNPTRETLESAGQLVEQAKALDPTDAEVWAMGAMNDAWMVFYTYDTAETRKERARSGSARALALDAKSYEARLARAFVLTTVVAQPSVRAEAETILRGLRQESPADHRVLDILANLLRDSGRNFEAADMFKQANSLNAAGWAYFLSEHYDEAEAVVDQALRTDRSVANLELKAMIYSVGREDLDAAQATMDRLPASALLEDHSASLAARIRMMRREPEKVLEILRPLPRDWLSSNEFVGPKAALTGDAHALANHPQAAEADWRSALQLVEQRLATDGNVPLLLLQKARLLAHLGDPAAAGRLLDLELQLSGQGTVSFSHLVQRKVIAVLIGRRAAVLDWVESELRNPGAFPFMHTVARFDPAFDPLRGDPRFEKLLRDTLPKGAKPFDNAQGRPFEDQKTEDGGRRTEDRGQNTEISAPIDQKSVAVLAFANLSDDKANEYFSDGISEELLNVLAKTPGLKVSARTSSFYFKGRNIPVPEIARTLGVAYVVEGSVRKAGGKVRITAQLVKAADGFQVWSDNFDRELKDIFAVQDEIAGLIVRQLSLKLGANPSGSVATVNPEAFELYLQGRQAWNLRSAEGYARAEQFLNRAIEIAPGFSRAQSALADVAMMRDEDAGRLGAFGQRHAPEFAEVIARIQRALAADPTQAETHASLGNAYTLGWNFAEGERSFRRAIELNPNYASAHQWLAFPLFFSGRIDEALAEQKRAAELDPLSPRILDNLGHGLRRVGHYAEAVAAFDRALSLQPGWPEAVGGKALACVALGRNAEAIALARQLPAGNPITAGFQISIFGQAGARKEAETLLARWKPEGNWSKAQLLLAVGQREKALAALDPATETLYPEHSDILLDPLFDSIRDDPRFGKFLATLGWTDAYARARAWRSTHPPTGLELKK